MNIINRFTFAFAVVVSSFVAPANACPHCTIFNHLGRNVDVATDIYVGQIAATSDKGSVVTVVEVIRGKRKVGSSVKEDIRGYKVGEKLILLSGDSGSGPFGPTFPQVPLDMKDEIVFLSGKERKIVDGADAVVKLHWVSKQSNELAFKYIKDHAPECRDLLIASFGSLLDRPAKWSDERFLYHRFENLAAALSSLDDVRSRDCLMQYIDTVARQPEEKFDWNVRKRYDDLPAQIFRAMLTRHEGTDETRRILGAHLEMRVRETKGSNLRWLVYGLAAYDLETCRRAAATLDADSRAAVADGLFLLSRYYAARWSYQASDEMSAAALSLSDSPKLRTLAEEQRKSLDFLRPKRDPKP